MHRVTAVVAVLVVAMVVFGGAGAVRAEAALSFAAQTQFGTGASPVGVASADFNGDGKPDLATKSNSSSSVSVLLGDGSGGFGANTDFGTGTGPYSIVSADFNGDGKPDLATSNASSFSVTVLLGDGSGGFPTRIDIATGRGPFSLETGDFNRDGNPDLAAANASYNTVSVLLGDGSGGFARADFATGARPLSIVSRDFNGDGKPDLATANLNSNTVSVLLGDGPGGFGAPTDFATGSSPGWIASADFNGDGASDIVVTNQGTNTVSVLLGDGSGGFGAKTDFDSGPSSYAVTTADLDGDGKSDLAVTSQGLPGVSVLLGDGSGGFGARTTFATGSTPFAVTSADFNGDGKQDLAVSNFSSNSVSVLLNTTNANPVANEDAYTVAADSGETSLDVLSNDTDAEGDPIGITGVSTPANGTATLVAGSPDEVVYTPEAGYCNDPGAGGTDDFTYTINGGASATVAVTVTCPETPAVMPLPAGAPLTGGALRPGLKLTRLSANHRCTRSATLTDPKTGANGLSFSFELSEAATVRYAILRRQNGPRWSKCPRPTSGTKTTFNPFAEGSGTGAKGLQSTSLAKAEPVTASASNTARIRTVAIGRKLKPGTYILKVRAISADGRKSKTKSVRFWVLGPKRA